MCGTCRRPHWPNCEYKQRPDRQMLRHRRGCKILAIQGAGLPSWEKGSVLQICSYFQSVHTWLHNEVWPILVTHRAGVIGPLTMSLGRRGSGDDDRGCIYRTCIGYLGTMENGNYYFIMGYILQTTLPGLRQRGSATAAELLSSPTFAALGGQAKKHRAAVGEHALYPKRRKQSNCKYSSFHFFSI